ncbi:phage integrase N-terminal SAM-like domain-containing protein [Leisingera sp. M527]|uniref:site-specific integrase n=1 Tax=Leisingera sp. M527 TaxID=2867014 RepID=UPI0021A5F7CF|nr:site-specific integrase [Leisingera sp. M527]UWQ33875.1 phage integrase N-terminal SAM-like domain-containing protein [Leisingera sp. M527]
MADAKTTHLRERMIEDMRIKGLGENSQKSHIRAVRYLAEFKGRSPDTASAEDLRAYQLHMLNTNVTPSTYKARLVGLRFFPPLKWSSAMFRKTAEYHGQQTAKARGDCHEVTAS